MSTRKPADTEMQPSVVLGRNLPALYPVRRRTTASSLIRGLGAGVNAHIEGNAPSSSVTVAWNLWRR
jgi:hypothetical protein